MSEGHLKLKAGEIHLRFNENSDDSEKAMVVIKEFVPMMMDILVEVDAHPMALFAALFVTSIGTLKANGQEAFCKALIEKAEQIVRETPDFSNASKH
ncbi:hypothetical protein UFOVP235_63 [uncultured Caudovirales phage]|uniref:Uncharacterized protein n=1 Tax=uncultured Caudovirales phage TaxID=2100421 RepID=A0A6J7WUB6_9CAUD|nr:hypothetical protein UFOVP235_63 [uncultured Caudovirales phage]